MTSPELYYKQVKHILKPFHKLLGKSFLEELEQLLQKLKLDSYARTVKLATEHLETEKQC